MLTISLLEPLAVILNVNVSDLISGEHDPKKFKAMEIYTILMELNRKMIFGEEISDAEKSKAVSFFPDDYLTVKKLAFNITEAVEKFTAVPWNSYLSTKPIKA